MSEVNYRRNGMKYSTTGKCWGVAPKVKSKSEEGRSEGAKPKSSRERRAVLFSRDIRLRRYVV